MLNIELAHTSRRDRGKRYQLERIERARTVTNRRLWTLLAAIAVVGLAGGTARAEGEEYKRLTLTVNAPYLLVPLFELNAEVAVRPNWSVAIRGGVGNSDLGGVPRTIMEFGGQAAYYATGNASRGVQLGLDTRLVSYEGDGMLAGLGDGIAAGPFVGYKRVFGPGFTLAAQVGAQVAISGESEDPVLPYVALSAGWSFWPASTVAADGTAEVVAHDGEPPELASPLDYHKGLMLGFSIGGGSASIEGCSACDLEPGISADASVGWFLSRRFALMVDSTATVALFSRSSGFGSFGFGLSSLALQYWPHEDFWLKVGVGSAQLTSASVGGTGVGTETGGGGTLAAGYEFHHDRAFAMDFQLRATHGSFHPANEKLEGVNTFVGLVGFHWY